MSGSLGEFELLVLLAVLQCADDAYGTTVRREIAERAERRVSRGAVYATLDRLEDKGLVRSSFGEPTAERGGRAKRFFRPTEPGLEAVRDARASMMRMWQGLEPILEDR